MRAASEVTGRYLGALFVLSLTALLTVVSFAAPGGLAIAAGLGMFVLTAIAWWRRMPTPTSFGAFFVPWIGFGLAGLGPQQVTFALAFVCYWVIVSRVAWLRDERRWCTVGSVGVRIMAFGVSFAAISGLALLVWHSTTQPDLDDLVATFVPDWPLWLLVPGAVAFSLANGMLEEAAYRGVGQHSLEGAVGAGSVALVLQAAAFAALHYQAGFPRGIAGIGLTFIYGLVLGGIRRRSGGLMAPVITHALTDLVIVTIVLSLVT